MGMVHGKRNWCYPFQEILYVHSLSLSIILKYLMISLHKQPPNIHLHVYSNKTTMELIDKMAINYQTSVHRFRFYEELARCEPSHGREQGNFMWIQQSSRLIYYGIGLNSHFILYISQDLQT